METTTCPACRSVNPSSVIACFRCGNRIGEPPVAPGLAQGASPLPLPPETLGNVSNAPAASPRHTALPIAMALAVVAVAATGAWLLIRDRGASLPESLGGHARNRTEAVRQMEELLSKTEIAGVRMEVAVYGDVAEQPTAMLMVFRGDLPALSGGSSEQFFQGLGSQVVSSGGASIDFTTASRATVAGVDYLCAPFRGTTSTGFGQGVGGTMCVFRGDVIGMTMFVAAAPPPATALTFTQDAYDELD
jgi:hypothetical protein